MNVLNMVYHKQDDAEKILFIENQFGTAKYLAEKIEGTEMFKRVYLLRRNKTRFMPLGVRRYSRAMFDLLTPRLYMKARLKDYPKAAEKLLSEKFDTIYLATVTPITASMLKLNPNAETILYDDGIGATTAIS